MPMPAWQLIGHLAVGWVSVQEWHRCHFKCARWARNSRQLRQACKKNIFRIHCASLTRNKIIPIAPGRQEQKSFATLWQHTGKNNILRSAAEPDHQESNSCQRRHFGMKQHPFHLHCARLGRNQAFHLSCASLARTNDRFSIFIASVQRRHRIYF